MRPNTSRARVAASRARALVAAAVAAWIGFPAAASAQSSGALDVLRIAQIEQVTNFDPALMTTQDMEAAPPPWITVCSPSARGPVPRAQASSSTRVSTPSTARPDPWPNAIR